jgi:hypothetical protein
MIAPCDSALISLIACCSLRSDWRSQDGKVCVAAVSVWIALLLLSASHASDHAKQREKEEYGFGGNDRSNMATR